MRAQCCICSDLFENSATVNIAAAPCGHTFHEVCFMRWMETSSTCPSCRTHVKKNQIIKRLYFDIADAVDESEDASRLLNQLGTIRTQVQEQCKQIRELTETLDRTTACLSVCQAEREDALGRVKQEKNATDVLRRDLSALQKENSLYIKELKAFQRTKQKLEQMRNVEMILKESETDIESMVGQYVDGGEAAVRNLASLVAVVKREYNKVLADKKKLREQVDLLKRDVGQSHSDSRKVHRKNKDLEKMLEQRAKDLFLMEKENVENRKTISQLKSLLRSNERRESAVKALTKDSPNVAYTPQNPQKMSRHPLVEKEGDYRRHGNRILPDLSLLENILTVDTPNAAQSPPAQSKEVVKLGQGSEKEEHDCGLADTEMSSPDLFESPSSSARASHSAAEKSDTPVLKLTQIPTLTEKFQAVKKAKMEARKEKDDPSLPFAMMNILKKKRNDSKDAKSHVSTVISKGYDGFGGTTTFVHSLGAPKTALMKMAAKRKTVKRNNLGNPKMLGNQPKVFDHLDLKGHKLSSTSSSSCSGKPSNPSMSLTKFVSKNAGPKLATSDDGYIDLT